MTLLQELALAWFACAPISMRQAYVKYGCVSAYAWPHYIVPGPIGIILNISFGIWRLW